MFSHILCLLKENLKSVLVIYIHTFTSGIQPGVLDGKGKGKGGQGAKLNFEKMGLESKVQKNVCSCLLIYIDLGGFDSESCLRMVD